MHTTFYLKATFSREQVLMDRPTQLKVMCRSEENATVWEPKDTDQDPLTYYVEIRGGTVLAGLLQRLFGCERHYATPNLDQHIPSR